DLLGVEAREEAQVLRHLFRELKVVEEAPQSAQDGEYVEAPEEIGRMEEGQEVFEVVEVLGPWVLPPVRGNVDLLHVLLVVAEDVVLATEAQLVPRLHEPLFVHRYAFPVQEDTVCASKVLHH